MAFGDHHGWSLHNRIFIMCSALLRCYYRASFVGGRASFCEHFLAECLYRKPLQVLVNEELLYIQQIALFHLQSLLGIDKRD